MCGKLLSLASAAIPIFVPCKKLYVRYIFLIISLLYASIITAQVSTPKRELRAVWIATVGNIDWPSKPGLSAQQQQQEFINQLNFLQRHGFNAVIVQVRAAADAFYPSAYEPWSRYLTGKQGQPPFPKYDPLEFMIRECHKRNMEFHAWFNPYRALTSSSNNPNPPDHATRQHPDWVIHYGGKSYFDPGNPAAREYILKVILDVVSRYDIDAVHIDDYFYPYKIPGKSFNDNSSYKKYNAEGMDLGNWRRNNVNLFVSQLNQNIKKEKAWVKFGVSPFGIWRNASQDPRGSSTNGTSCYDDLYSDVKLWMDQKWMDYVAPQLYWEHGHRLAAYDVLLPWWVDNSKDCQLYIGLGLYRMTGSPKDPWTDSEEILKQIRAARKQKVEGLIFFSMSNFYKIKSDLADSLQYRYFGHIAIPPATPRLDAIAPPAPALKANFSGNSARLDWATDKTKKETLKFLVYRFESDRPIDLEDAKHIIALTGNLTFTDQDAPKGAKYVVTALDRLWNESAASNIVDRQTD